MTKSRTSSQGGSWSLFHILRDIAISWQLMGDPQVSGLLKLCLPVFAFLYWVSPIDLLVGMPFDDIAIFVLASRVFVQLAPAEAVERARRKLGAFGGYTQRPTPVSDQPGGEAWDDNDGKTIAGEWRVVDD